MDGSETSYLTILVNRNPEAANLEFKVKVSSDLTNWFSGEHVSTLQDNPSLLKVRDAVPTHSNSQRYILLEVTNPH